MEGAMSIPITPGRNRLILLVALAVPALLLAGATCTWAAPAIESLSATEAPRSGRLLIRGAGFGDLQGTGRVEIAGLPAIVTRWWDTQITAYVPEAAPLGPGAVRVAIDGVTSNDAALEIQARAPLGRVQWRFRLDSDYMDQRPAVGPDGTIVAQDSSGFVYALTPDGGL